MKKWFVLGLLLWASPQVWGQCPTNSTIAVNPTNYSLLMPSDVPSATATLSVTAQGGLPSHNITVSYLTNISFTWNFTNCGGYVNKTYVSENGGAWQQFYPDNMPNGFVSNFGPYGNAGSTYVFKFVILDQHGNQITQDQVKEIVVSGPIGTISYQDELPTNLYQQATASFSGTSSMACGACQQNPQACSNVTHEGRISFELDNLTSGEVQTQAMIYGPLINPTFNNGLTSNPLYLSVLPGDTTQDSQTDQVECSLYGLFYNQSPTNPGGYTTKTMKTKIHIDQQGSTTAGITRWYVSSRCKDTQHVPIWEPEYIDTKGAATILTSEGQYDISYQDCKAKPGMPEWSCPPIAVTPPQPLTIGVGGTLYDCSTLINTPLPQ